MIGRIICFIISCIVILAALLTGQKYHIGRYFSGADTTHSKKFTAVIMSEYIPCKYAAKMLPDFTISTDLKNADFIYADGKFLQTNKINKPLARLKCRLDARNLFDKALLHDKLSELLPSAICKTVTVTANTEIPPGVVWIVKASWGFHGRGNIIVTNQKELTIAYEKLVVPPADMPYYSKNVEIIASEYIRNPMLYRGYKFHLRLYVVYLVTNDASHAWLKNTGIIVPAGEPYVDSDYANTKIHDSHFDKNPQLIGLYPDDINDTLCAVRLPGVENTVINTAKIASSVQTMLRDVFRVMSPFVSKYREAQNAYDMYGVDVMFDGETPKLLEINRFPAFFVGDELINARIDTSIWNSELFDTVVAGAVHEVFKVGGANSELITKLF